MSMTDPIADLLTRIRNAGMANHPKLEIPASRVKVELASVLKDLGYIKNYKLTMDDVQGHLQIYLKYDDTQNHVIHEIQRVSKHGCRMYVGKSDIPQVKNGHGAAILSTSKGVMDDEAARQAGVGGELLCTVW